MAATNLPDTLPGTLPSANYQPTYRSTGACDDLAELVAPYSLSRAQLAEATGIADEATVNGWIEQCCPDLAAPAPLEPVLRYLDETYLPDPANWPGTNPYDEFILENIAARMLAHVVADTFGADRSDSYRELLALIATLVLIARYWDAPEETFLTLLNAEPTAEAGEYLQEAIANAPESLYPLLTELLLPALPQAHDVIAFSTRSGEGTSALADDPRAAFTLYLCYLMLGDDESSEERAAELYRASRGE